MVAVLCAGSVARGQAYGEADRSSPGDAAIQEWLAARAAAIHARFLDGVETLDDWTRERPRLVREYLWMLGLDPLPERTPLNARITGTLAGDGFVVEKLVFESRPRLYVTANLYRPATRAPGERLPATLYVCGHSPQGRNGNKTAYQSNGIWLARHGQIALLVDTLQLGEIAGVHHGTYREGRWWWLSRGYTPAGVECWNGVRALDYLESRDDVDPTRLAVTGISGGGAASFWIAAADERVRATAPVSGMADLPSYVGNRVINGHCDCMFLHNSHAWPWTNIAALIAPRPLLFVNSHEDPIFPMDANERVAARLERVWALHGAGHRVDALVSLGGHAYREDIRRGVFRFLRTWLQGDPTEPSDTEVDLVTGERGARAFPIPPESLRVFPTDADLPPDRLNAEIDRWFVPVAEVSDPGTGEHAAWSATLSRRLRERVFPRVELPVPASRVVAEHESGALDLVVRDGVPYRLTALRRVDRPSRLRIVVCLEPSPTRPRGSATLGESTAVVACQPRGVGPSAWTTRDPPNFVERSHVLVGTTVDRERVVEILGAIALLRERHPSAALEIEGEGAAGVLAAYAAALEPAVGRVRLVSPPTSHMDADSPRLLDVLRTLDIPELLGLLADRRLTLERAEERLVTRVRGLWSAADALERLETGTP